MTSSDAVELAIFAAAYVDALRSIFEDVPMPDRVWRAEREAAYVVEMWRKHRGHAEQ